MEPAPKPKPADKDDISDMIAYALWRNWKLRPAKRDLAATREWAKRVTAHLELCGVEWSRKPPNQPHGTGNFLTGNF